MATLKAVEEAAKRRDAAIREAQGLIRGVEEAQRGQVNAILDKIGRIVCWATLFFPETEDRAMGNISGWVTEDGKICFSPSRNVRAFQMDRGDAVKLRDWLLALLPLEESDG